MATLVGMHGNFSDAMNDLLELEYDALKAYEAAISRLEDEQYQEDQAKLVEFKNDHERHVKEISDLLFELGYKPAEGPTTKSWLTKGKVVLATIMGGRGILEAMDSNEIDTNSAYINMLGRDDIWQEAKTFLEKGLADERRHKQWFEQRLEKK